jgi:hypothetical protein
MKFAGLAKFLRGPYDFKMPIFILFFFFISLSVHAAENESIEKLTGAPAKRSEVFRMSPFLEIPSQAFLISTDQGRVDQAKVDQRISYSPTFGMNLGVKLGYRATSLSISKRVNFSTASSREIYGDTDFMDMRFGYQISKTLRIETYYQDYQGFFADLSGQQGLQLSFGNGVVSSSSILEPKIINRPDLEALNYGAKLQHSFNLMPLLRAGATPEQIESSEAWNIFWLSQAYYNRIRMMGSKALVPSESSGAFSPIADLSEFWTHSLGLGTGLGAEVLMTKTFAMGFEVLLALGLQKQSQIFLTEQHSGLATSSAMNSKMFLDWRGQLQSFRIHLNWDLFSSRYRDIHFDTSNLGLTIAYSRSFGH